MGKLIVICGPTATGKTSLALKLCQKFNGEIVSIDSRQVYKGMDVGTGKLPLPAGKESLKKKSPKERLARKKARLLRNSQSLALGNRQPGNSGSGELAVERGEDHWIITGVKIHLYDLIEPDEELNAVQFAKIAGSTIERIWAREKVPVLVGGSGLYLEVLLGMVEVAKVPPDPELRKESEKLSNEELFARLKELDPERAKTIDKNSPHRLIRAIEIARGLQFAGGKKPRQGKPSRFKDPNLEGLGIGAIAESAEPRQVVEVLPRDLEPLWIGLNAPRETLYQRIDERIDGMIEAGLLEEISHLVEKYGWEAPALNSIGYIEFKPHFEGEAALEECITRAKFNTHAYARRQLTWFRRNKDIQWFDVTKENFDEEVERLVES